MSEARGIRGGEGLMENLEITEETTVVRWCTGMSAVDMHSVECSAASSSSGEELQGSVAGIMRSFVV